LSDELELSRDSERDLKTKRRFGGGAEGRKAERNVLPVDFRWAPVTRIGAFRMWKGSVLGALIGMCIVAFGIAADAARSDDDASILSVIGEANSIKLRTFEETKKARNKHLAEAFATFRDSRGGKATAETVRGFNALLCGRGLTTFDDFQRDEMTPFREVKDPATGDSVPVFGPLGSDLINPWLADMEIAEGQPMEDQPAYLCARNALREHLDFVLVGERDPNLCLDSLPGKLRENAVAMYARLNPTNRFDGGFDQPLFYATVRFAAKKLFREDYPQAKLTMAQLVVAEERGGFGIRSCLLCHEASHVGVYRRLLGQALYSEAKSRENAPEAARAAAESANYAEAARHVLAAHGDKIDERAVRRSLTASSADNIERLKPGYDDFAAVLGNLGCLSCHCTTGTPPQNKDPREHGAWVLQPSTYNKTENIQALLPQIKNDDVERSPLLLKAKGELDHEGVETVKLDAQQAARLQQALTG